jgi:hypothetical protein
MNYEREYIISDVMSGFGVVKGLVAGRTGLLDETGTLLYTASERWYLRGTGAPFTDIRKPGEDKQMTVFQPIMRHPGLPDMEYPGFKGLVGTTAKRIAIECDSFSEAAQSFGYKVIKDPEIVKTIFGLEDPAFFHYRNVYQFVR